MNNIARLFALLMALAVAGCASTPSSVAPTDSRFTQLDKAAVEIPEAQLLDVWIELFDSGRALGRFPEIREAESRFIPVHLRNTMEKSGYWGAVRVVPAGAEGAEILVRGELLRSDTDGLAVAITAEDAAGSVWFRSVYKAGAPTHAAGSAELYQPLYNAIANDLAHYRASLTPSRIDGIRRLAEMRFAADLLPEAFSGMIKEGEDARLHLVHSPNEKDPMLRRIRAVRERDYMLVDTLNGHYDNFYREMETPYRQWREALIDETAALRELESQATSRKLLGFGAIIGAIALEAFSGGRFRGNTSSLRNLMLVGGTYALKTGYDKDSETEIHREVIAELDDSFATEVGPLVVEVEGQVHELTGSAEAQFNEWRRLLRRIYTQDPELSGGHDKERI